MTLSKKLGKMGHTFNPRIQEAEAGGSQWVQGWPGLQREFQNNKEILSKKKRKKEEEKEEGRRGEKQTNNYGSKMEKLYDMQDLNQAPVCSLVPPGP